MNLQQAQKYLESLPPEVYVKYAKAWSEMHWRMPTEILLANFIKASHDQRTTQIPTNLAKSYL